MRSLPVESTPRTGPEGREGSWPLEDAFGRRVRYLRLSITDRCNLRCSYCTSRGAFETAPASELLSHEEILAVVGALVPEGLEKVRITGGEPLVRRGVVDLVRRLGRLGLARVALSTNGVLLEPIVGALHDAGLEHLNVSVDTLDPERFRVLSGGASVGRVLRGIERALEVGVSTVKLNCVLLRGINDGEVVDLARLALRWPVTVRFIELMPLGSCGLPHAEHYVPAATVLGRIAGELGPLEPVDVRRADDGPARTFRLAAHPEAPGAIGVVTPQSSSFCGSCNRVRLSAVGRLRTCLFGDETVDLRAVVRRPGATADEIVAAVRGALVRKPRQNAGHRGLAMQAIGG